MNGYLVQKLELVNLNLQKIAKWFENGCEFGMTNNNDNNNFWVKKQRLVENVLPKEENYIQKKNFLMINFSTYSSIFF